MSYSSTVRAADVTEQRRRQDECTTRAIVEGTKAAALAGLVSGGCGQLLKAVSEAYRLKFTAGPRAAVVAMPVFAAFWVVSEKQVRQGSWQGASIDVNTPRQKRGACDHTQTNKLNTTQQYNKKHTNNTKR